MSWLVLLLQVVAGSVASFIVGMVWFSSLCLGKVWWKYTFPNRKYGVTAGLNDGRLHLLCTGSNIFQSLIIAYIVNYILPSHSFSSLPLTLLCAVLLSVFVACTTYPHYLYADKPTILFLTCIGYNVIQTTMAFAAIHSLAVVFYSY